MATFFRNFSGKTAKKITCRRLLGTFFSVSFLLITILLSDTQAAPVAPKISGLTPTNDTTPTWTWISGGGGTGTFRYRLDTGTWTVTKKFTFTPVAPLAEGPHVLYVQERDLSGVWSTSGISRIVVDLTMPEVELAIKNFFKAMRNRVITHNTPGFLSLFASDYMHNGDDKNVVSADPPDLSTVSTFNFSINKIVIAGNTAKAYGTCRVTFNDGSPAVSWVEPDMSKNSEGLGWLKKTAAGWKVWGNQARADVRVTSGHNVTAGEDHYFLRVTASSSQAIHSVTIQGPGVPITALQRDDWYGGFSGFILPVPLPPVKTSYSFTVNFEDGTSQILNDIIHAYISTGPNVTVTTNSGSATFQWTDLSPTVANAEFFWVRVWNDIGLIWESSYLPTTQMSIIFNEDGTAQGALESGKAYVTEVFLFNSTGDYAYQRAFFTMP